MKNALVLLLVVLCSVATCKAATQEELVNDFYTNVTCSSWLGIDDAIYSEMDEAVVETAKMSYIIGAIDSLYIMCMVLKEAGYEATKCDFPYRYGQYKIEVDVWCEDEEFSDTNIAEMLILVNGSMKDR